MVYSVDKERLDNQYIVIPPQADVGVGLVLPSYIGLHNILLMTDYLNTSKPYYESLHDWTSDLIQSVPSDITETCGLWLGNDENTFYLNS